MAWSGMTLFSTWLASAPTVTPMPSPEGQGSVSLPVARVAPVPGAAAQRAQAALAAEVIAAADRLQAGLSTRPVYQAPARNLFQYRALAAPTPRPVARPVVAPAAMPLAAPVLAPVDGPKLALIGLAEERVGDEVSRTAVLSAPGDVVLAKEGDEVSGYRVERIAGDHVELSRLADGSAFRLSIRP